MMHVTPNFTSGYTKVVVTVIPRDEALLQFFQDDFGLTEEENSGEEAEGTYIYFGSQVWIQMLWQL